MKKLAIATAVAAMVSGGLVQAANDGLESTSSTGDFDLSLSIGNIVTVKNLDDMPLGVYTGTGNMTGIEDFCIGTNSGGNGLVAFSVTSAAGGSSFQMQGNGAPENILPYSVQWSNDGSTPAPLTHGVPVAFAAQLANDQRLACLADNMQLIVEVKEDDLNGTNGAISNDMYADTITVTVAAQ